MEELERAQEQAKKIEMLKMDPACWRGYADQGYFQKAEDMLIAATEAEEELAGSNTLRFARLQQALGELYDHRSNIDITGQQQALSLKSARFAGAAVEVLEAGVQRAEGREGTAQEEEEERELLASALLLRGRSLCNFALDGDSQEVRAKRAFEDAEVDLMRCSKMLEGASADKLAKVHMSVGYLHYCRAGCISNAEDSSMSEVITSPEVAAESYVLAEKYYKKSLDSHIDFGGEAHEDSIRMMCNLGLVHNSMARLPLSTRVQSLAEARKWYERALGLQLKAFGKRHDRTLRIQEDLQDLQERQEGEEALAKGEEASVKAVKRTQDDEEREKEADLLMQEFLKARRQERMQEQTSMVQDLQTRQQQQAGDDEGL